MFATMDPVHQITIGRWADLHPENPYAPTLRERMTLPNPALRLARIRGLSTLDIPPDFPIYFETPNRLRVPRAAVFDPELLMASR